MIELTEEPYDGPVATALVQALHADIAERYAGETESWTAEEIHADDVAYLAEITPELVRAPHGSFVVAWVDGEPAGCGAVKPLDHAVGVGEIKRMYTAPGARRRGIASAVLRKLEAAATELGYERLQLETGSAQPEALAVYEAHGWHRIEGYGRYRDLPSSICFAKALPAR